MHMHNDNAMAKVRLIPPPRDAKHVRVRYRNPRVQTRSGKFVPGSVVVDMDGLRLEIHSVYGASRVLGRSAPRVQQLLKAGKLTGYQIGKEWIVFDADLRAFIKQERVKVRKRFAAFLSDDDSGGKIEKNRVEKP